MDFGDALRRYRAAAFTDEDVTRCTGLTVRAWRELIKLGAVRTISEPRRRGHIRLCDAVGVELAVLDHQRRVVEGYVAGQLLVAADHLRAAGRVGASPLIRGGQRGIVRFARFLGRRMVSTPIPYASSTFYAIPVSANPSPAE
jgi:hypothetical protein